MLLTISALMVGFLSANDATQMLECSNKKALGTSYVRVYNSDGHCNGDKRKSKLALVYVNDDIGKPVVFCAQGDLSAFKEGQEMQFVVQSAFAWHFIDDQTITYNQTKKTIWLQEQTFYCSNKTVRGE
jgi:hypothetical protein